MPRRPDGSRIPGWDTPADLTKAPATIPDPATTPVPDHLRIEIEGYVARYPDAKSAIIPALWAAQREHHWTSPTAVAQVAAVLQRTPAEIMAVATFYDMFETEEIGTNTVYVCTNISCSLRGADALLHEFEAQTKDRKDEFHVRGFECLGACDIAPMISIDGLYIGPIDLDEVSQILETVVTDGRTAVFPERQINNRPSMDPGAGDAPTHGAAGPQTPLADAPKSAAEAGATAAADPRRESSATQPSSDPSNVQPTEDRATGQDPEEDSL
ncbi:MAG: NAD(P)H-dependent oxidoreductase subunit E [Solirubrobacteraceae bacterium]|nr:NAD(P)H-dependent oxidoreductase subunit E [Solirubrobacteraceae bacterium]